MNNAIKGLVQSEVENLTGLLEDRLYDVVQDALRDYGYVDPCVHIVIQGVPMPTVKVWSENNNTCISVVYS